MKAVNVRRTLLLEKVTANRAAHRDLFLKAQEGFRARAIEELDKMLQEARDRSGPVRLFVGLTEPQDHTSDYDRVVAMLEMSVEEFIDIDAASFACYVMDEWGWKATALHVNSTYASGGKL